MKLEENGDAVGCTSRGKTPARQKGKNGPGPTPCCASVPAPGAQPGSPPSRPLSGESNLPDPIQGCISVCLHHSLSFSQSAISPPFPRTSRLWASSILVLSLHSYCPERVGSASSRRSSRGGHGAPWAPSDSCNDKAHGGILAFLSLKPGACKAPPPYLFPELESLSRLPPTGIASFWI